MTKLQEHFFSRSFDRSPRLTDGIQWRAQNTVVRPMRSWHNKRGDTPLRDVSGTNNVLLRCLGDSGSQLVEWRAQVHPPEWIPPRHCFPTFLPPRLPPPFITFLAFFMAQVWSGLQRKPRFLSSDRDPRDYVGRRFSNSASSSFRAKDG